MDFEIDLVGVDEDSHHGLGYFFPVLKLFLPFSPNFPEQVSQVLMRFRSWNHSSNGLFSGLALIARYAFIRLFHW